MNSTSYESLFESPLLPVPARTSASVTNNCPVGSSFSGDVVGPQGSRIGEDFERFSGAIEVAGPRPFHKNAEYLDPRAILREEWFEAKTVWGARIIH